MSPVLIVNADDFGQSAGINEGVIRAIERGPVRSASVMVRWPGAPAAARYAATRPDVSFGLHIDLGEWSFRDDAWTTVYDVVDTKDEQQVVDEIGRQIAQ